MQDTERTESIGVIEEIFRATGALAETFVFTGPASYYPLGILEVAFRDTNNRWVDLNVNKYTINAGGLSFSLNPGTHIDAGTSVRCIYLGLHSLVHLDLPSVLDGKHFDLTGGVDQLPAMPLKSGMSLYAAAGNAATIWIGGAAVGVDDGFPLLAGESVAVPADDLSRVYVTGTAADIIYFIAG